MLGWRRRAAWTVLRENWGLGAVLVFCALSVIWSDYSDLTLRRSILFLFTTVTAAAIAASAPNPRRLHTALFASLTGVILVNLAVTALAPGQAITEIGVRGVYNAEKCGGLCVDADADCRRCLDVGRASGRGSAGSARSLCCRRCYSS